MEKLPIPLPAALENNPYFSAGFGLGIMGTALALARGSARAASTLAQRHLLTTLELTSKDKAYPWVLNWLSANSTKSAMAQHLSVDTVVERLADGRASTRFEFAPCPGRHVVRYRGQLIMVDRMREQQTVDLHTGAPWESVKLTALGRTPDVFSALLREAMEHAESKRERTTTIFTNWGTEWRPFGTPRRPRPLSSVVLADGVAEHLLADVDEFTQSQPWYARRGIPYRRGYLLHGPPGSGKSSFVAALAGHIRYDICILNLSEAGLTDDRLSHALTHTPPQSIVLLEDVDAAFIERQPGDERKQRTPFVTFSGLLNALDGVAAGEERLVFMTTNHIERLDAALIRPGRVDVIHEIGNADASQASRLFRNFYPDAEPAEADGFARAIDGASLSMAMLQSYLMLYRDSPRDALSHAAEMAEAMRGATNVAMQQRLSEARVQERATTATAGGGAGQSAASDQAGDVE